MKLLAVLVLSLAAMFLYDSLRTEGMDLSMRPSTYWMVFILSAVAVTLWYGGSAI